MILNEPGLIEYIVIAGYFAMLIGIGFIMKKLNSNVSDYFRSGCRGSWYLVGASAFMAALSSVASMPPEPSVSKRSNTSCNS